MNKAEQLDAALRKLSPGELEKIPAFFLRDVRFQLAPRRWQSVALYLASLIVVNLSWEHIPMIVLPWVGPWSIGSVLVGGVLVARDYAQSRCGDWVIVAMLGGLGVTYVLCSPGLTYASAGAFATAEGLEYLIFRFTRLPFRERVVASVVPSAVADSLVFLMLAPFPFSWALFLAQVVSKLLAVLVFVPMTRPRPATSMEAV